MHRCEMSQYDVGESFGAEPVARAGRRDIARSRTGTNCTRYGRFDSLGRGLGPTAVPQQHGRTQDRTARIGDALPRDIGRRAVHRLEHRGEQAGRIDIA